MVVLDGGKRFSYPMLVCRRLGKRYRTMLSFGDFGRKFLGIDRCDTYCRSAAQCTALARKMESLEDRAVLLQMALMWVRLAEHAAKVADLYPEGKSKDE